MEEFIESFEAQAKALRFTIQEIIWGFRGGLSRSEAWSLTSKERQEHLDYIEERWKLVEKLKMPVI